MDYELSRHAERRMRERDIRQEWLELAFQRPVLIKRDEIDPSVEHRLVAIEEVGGRVLRVVCDPKVSPIRVITVHMDRSPKGKL